MSFFALLFRPGAFAQTSVVRADEVEDDGDTVRLFRDGALVWRGPRRAVATVTRCDSEREASEVCREHRESVGRGHNPSLALDEGGAARLPNRRDVARKRGTSIPAEGVRIMLEET